jgi:GxxExxY protein
MTTVSRDIFNSCIKIHKTLGPGLFEIVYKQCLAYELQKLGHDVDVEVLLPVSYETLDFENGYKADLLVNKKIMIELKSVDKLSAVHKAQLLTYLKLSNYPLGFLINFGETLVKDGFHRFANGEEANGM